MTDPIGREVVGKVVISTGEVTVYLPLIMDIIDHDFKAPDFTWRVCAAAVGVPYADFLMWPIPDALKVAQIVGSSINRL